MTYEEFQAIIAAHGGLRDADPAVLDPEIDVEETNEITGKATKTKKPNPAPKRRYVFNDGTTLVAVWKADGAMQIVDPGTALNKTGVAATEPGAKAPETKAFPDGTERQWDPERRDWVIIATKPQGPEPNKPEAGTLPGVNLGARRPGQKVDLALVEQQANAYIASLNADKSLTPEQRNQRLQAYVAANVKPQVDQATAEANAEQARLTQRQQEQDQQARDQAVRQGRQEDRLTATADRQSRTAEQQAQTAERNARTAEDTLAFNRQKSEYDAGQDAVSNAMKLLPYQVGPTFGAEFSSALNTLGSGGGPVSFTPSGVTFQAPDYAAIAEAAAQRAHALYSVPVAGATQGVASAPVQAPPALASLPVQSIPPVTPATRDQYYR